MNLTARGLIPSLFFALVVYFFYSVRAVLLPFILAAVLAYLLNPFVAFFQVRGFRRRPMVVVVFVGFLTVVSIFLLLGFNKASEEATKAAAQMPAYVRRGQVLVNDLKAVAQRNPSSFLGHVVNGESLDRVLQEGKRLPGVVLEGMPRFAFRLIPFIELVLLVPFIAFFLMLEGPALLSGVLHIVPARYVEMWLNILVEFDNSLGNYMRGMCLEAVCVSVAALFGFWLIGLDYAFQIALFVGLTNVIPLIGPIMVGLLGCSVALFQWGTAAGLLKALMVCAGVRVLEDWLFHPLVLKNAVHLHPVVIVFSLMAGAELWGFWGLLFGVPAACMVKVLMHVTWQWYRSQYGYRPDVVPARALHIPLI